ncbi:LLM class F420-dependent oxidoreductase [Actinopolymorpha alba]|uniref:LLM class F420-dependent oxidoreductase n=1 Tax=Actinopolymorpha alba TaxID=533267 RepID=UPI00036F8BDF|nr:LLM class F420-dependent oxidoreductase [Actinopolymorpha alba]
MDLRIFTEPQQGASYDALLRLAQTSEECAYDAFFRSDHYLVMGDGDGLPGPTDAWTHLAGLARETSRIRLGTLVSPVTFRFPGILAIQVAQVDQMSGGRVELGLGAGWFEAEHRAYGIPFPPKRFDLFEEQLAIITGLWKTPVGERFGFAGQHYTLEDSPALPKPVQSPHPPIIIGGGGPRRTPALAARYAAEFNLGFAGPEAMRPGFERVRAACVAAGRDPDSLVLSAALALCCGKDDAQVRQRADAIRRDADELRRDGLAGTPDELVERIGQYAELGVSRLYLQVLDIEDLDQVELVASDVVPQLEPLRRGMITFT